ncbi:MAG: hypothetical protein ACOH18_00295 [Candidatus Saccharimonadaceae bacterium]
MNGDPYRAPQPADRRVINRSGQQVAAGYQRVEEQPQPASEEQPKTLPRSSNVNRSTAPEQKSSKKGLWWTIVVSLLILLIAVAGWLIWSSSNRSANAGIDSSKYQAVFLTNGQIYFGKLKTYSDEYLSLTTGYYPQAKSTDTTDSKTTDSAANASGIQLIRLGDEVYGPENEIFISKKQILHYENLKSDSKVSQLIDKNEKSK